MYNIVLSIVVFGLWAAYITFKVSETTNSKTPRIIVGFGSVAFGVAMYFVVSSLFMGLFWYGAAEAHEGFHGPNFKFMAFAQANINAWMKYATIAWFTSVALAASSFISWKAMLTKARLTITPWDDVALLTPAFLGSLGFTAGVLLTSYEIWIKAVLIIMPLVMMYTVQRTTQPRWSLSATA